MHERRSLHSLAHWRQLFVFEWLYWRQVSKKKSILNTHTHTHLIFVIFYQMRNKHRSLQLIALHEQWHLPEKRKQHIRMRLQARLYRLQL
jgi:hypothetical protein